LSRETRTVPAPETLFGYDSANRLTSLTHKQGASTIAGYTWTFDDNAAAARIRAAFPGDELRLIPKR
jgi:hypothetical protein